ncbi:MAG TPA: helicase-related protein [Terriglobales bacterium]|nr:helicase-related protein [Terriglobales bacterium]
MKQDDITDIATYLTQHSDEIGNRILTSYPALYGAEEAPSPLLAEMLRTPYPAQTIAVMGVSRRWQQARNANVVAECGTGKTLIALSSMLVHSAGRRFTGLVMAPPHLVEKWAREAFLTLPQIRVFLIDDMRNGGSPREAHGINEVQLRRGEIVREGLHTSLSELRRLGRKGWQRNCPVSSIFCIGREKAKLSYFWKHCYGHARSGPYLGSLTNPDTGRPIETDGVRWSTMDFDQKRRHEVVHQPKGGTTRYCALWQADREKIARIAPAEYMGRYMAEWWDYAVADEIHQLAGDTAQGNALGVLNRVAKRFLGLTGTLLSGYADDLFNTLFRTDAKRMITDGYEWGPGGRERFTRDFGVIETVERITVEDNACSKKTKKEVTVKRKPGASPLLFGAYLMDHCAFIGLEDISDGLPSYREDVLAVPLEHPLQPAYERLEEEIRACLKEHRGNSSVVAIMLNALLAWPDHPYGFGTLYGSEFNPDAGSRQRFVIAETVDMDPQLTFPKEQALLDEVRAQLARGRKCQVFAVYTNKHDVTARLEQLFRTAGIRAAILRATVPTHKRETWYREQLRRGIDVAICHPKIVETGLDLLDFPTILFHETGYSLHTLLQASRRSWRIGQKRPVEVKFFAYNDTMQEVCLRLMGKKLLVALAMEGKFASEGLQAIDGDDDMLTAMARELVEKKGIGESAQNVWRSLGQLRPEPPARRPEELEGAQAVQAKMGNPALSEDSPTSGDGEESPPSSSHRPDIEQLSLF